MKEESILQVEFKDRIEARFFSNTCFLTPQSLQQEALTFVSKIKRSASEYV